MTRRIIPSKASMTSLILAALLVAGGCATNRTSGSGGQPAYAEFLSQPARLRPVADGSGALAWVDTGADLKRFNKFLIEPIQVRLADDAGHKTVDPAQLKALTDYLQQAIVKALTPTYQIVTKPGPGVLRIRIAITDLVPTKPQYSVAALVVPYATVVDVASGVAAGQSAGSPPYLGRTGIAAMLIDAQNQQLVAEYADTRIGRKYVVAPGQGVTGAIRAGVGNYLKSYSTWAYAHQAFDGWAAVLRRWLDRVQGRQPG